MAARCYDIVAEIFGCRSFVLTQLIREPLTRGTAWVMGLVQVRFQKSHPPVHLALHGYHPWLKLGTSTR